MPPKGISQTSLYFPIKEKAEALMTPAGPYMPAEDFAKDVFPKLVKANPPALFWAGSMTLAPRIVNFFVFLFGVRVWDLVTGGVSGLSELSNMVRLKEMKKE